MGHLAHELVVNNICRLKKKLYYVGRAQFSISKSLKVKYPSAYPLNSIENGEI